MTEDNQNRTGKNLFGESRPIIDLPRSPLENILEAMAAFGVLAPLYYLIKLWPQLPTSFPTHFDGAGIPDGWGGKESLIPLVIITLFLYALLTGISFFPHIYNYPVKITPENAERQYRLARSLILWMKVELVWLFGYIHWSSLQVALGKAGGLGIAFLPATLAVVFGTIGIYLWKSFRQGQNLT